MDAIGEEKEEGDDGNDIRHLMRIASDSFFTAFKVVGQAWVRHGGVLRLDWMQRQLITENNIALTLYALNDTNGSVHFTHSSICLLTDIEDRYGAFPWLQSIDQSLQWLVLAVRQRQMDEAIDEDEDEDKDEDEEEEDEDEEEKEKEKEG